MNNNTPIRLLCTGDLHLGRRPSRTRSQDDALSVDHVWQRIVDYAINQRVDALVLTGDVVDADNQYFEAYGALQRGLQRLKQAQLPTYAVAGNHDYGVLPSLIDVLGTEYFHLLGRGGHWETTLLQRDGTPALRFVGWSFPDRHVTQSPVGHLTLEPADLPTVALVHGDLDQKHSQYAPLERNAMLDFPVDAWLLGHIHQPAYHQASGRCVLYPGSPQPLDPGEEGSRGPRLVTVQPGHEVDVRPIPMATLEYVTLKVDLSEVDEEDGFRETVTSALQDDLRGRCKANAALRRVVYRLRYKGRTPTHRHLDAWTELTADLEVSHEQATAYIDQAVLETRPLLDLEALSRGSDPPGVLARLLLDLQQGDDSKAQELIRGIDAELTGVSRARAYGPLRRYERTADAPDPTLARKLILRQGMLLLDEMMAQQQP